MLLFESPVALLGPVAAHPLLSKGETHPYAESQHERFRHYWILQPLGCRACPEETSDPYHLDCTPVIIKLILKIDTVCTFAQRFKSSGLGLNALFDLLRPWCELFLCRAKQRALHHLHPIWVLKTEHKYCINLYLALPWRVSCTPNA